MGAQESGQRLQLIATSAGLAPVPFACGFDLVDPTFNAASDELIERKGHTLGTTLGSCEQLVGNFRR